MRALLTLLAVALIAKGAWIPVKAALAQILLERAWNEVEAGGEARPPWPGADTVPAGRLAIAGKSFIVLTGAAGKAMAFAPALMEGVDTPVISAHRDTHFRVLGDVAIGDDLSWTSSGQTRHYRIASLDVVDDSSVSVARDALILTTCWPLNGMVRGPERLVVTAIPTESNDMRAP